MFEKQRLSDKNLDQYVGFKTGYPKLVSKIPCLLQNDYGKDNDCTLTSITAIVKYYNPTKDVELIYNRVEAIAKTRGYTGWYGTPNLTITSIYNKALSDFNLNKKAQGFYGKGIGYSFNKIQNEVNQNHPILLNLWKDGRNYYKNHSVLIVGYLIAGDKKFLAIYDNWDYGVSYIDYDKLSIVSSIQILKDK